MGAHDRSRKHVSRDGVDRRDLLKCAAWAGTGLLWTFSGGVPTSHAFADTQTPAKAGSFSFVQISDSHIGFSKPANMDATATLKAAVDKINASQSTQRGDLILHTGDVSHISTPAQFDTAEQVIKGAKVGRVFYVPGEHDVSYDGGASYREHFGKGTRGGGWYSFDHKGVHFMGLNNVVMLDAMGDLGPQQLEWMKNDVSNLSSSTPIVLFAHIPLWMIYPQWGWGTDDGTQALSLLKRFGSVTVLNGHIHQIVQKVEGNVSFHTAMSTAFPQPAPGSAPHAGPMVMPAGQLATVLGVRTVNYVTQDSPLAIVDSSLAVQS
jgi:Icc protein